MLVFFAAFLLSIGLFSAHLAGMDGIYFTMPLFDIVTHTLGGVTVAFFVYGFAEHFQKLRRRRLATVMATIVVAIMWEVFEIYFDLAAYPIGSRAYILDTLKDIVLGTIGAAVAAYAAQGLSKLGRPRNNELN